jgi:N-acetylneuraminate lyase
MHADGSLNLDAVEKLAARLDRDGVAGAFPCGTTGEFASLSAAERMQVAERWCAVAGRDLQVIVHVGGTCLGDSKLLAAHAQKCGAQAISAIGPFFFKPRSVEDLVAYCAEIAAAAPSLPFYYYHIPTLSGVDLQMTEFLESGKSRIPTLAGIKFSHLDLMDLGRCVRLDDGRFQILFGVDEVLVSGLVLGARAAVGTTYGFAAPLSTRILDAFGRGDLEGARRLQARSMEMVSVFIRYGGHPAMKATMKITGLDCGPVRPPLRQLRKEEYESLVAELEAIGFQDFCSRP